MASGVSGYFDITGTYEFTVRVHYAETYDIATNTSTVTIKNVQVNSGWYKGVTYYLNGTISIDGTTVVTMNSRQGGHSVRPSAINTFCDISGTLGSLSGITHNADGGKSVNIGVSLNGFTTSGEYGNGWGASATKAIALTAIPRTSSLYAPNGTLGVLQAVTVTKQADAFTHTITYSCGSASGTVCTKSSAMYVNWTPPMDLALQNTTGTSVAVTFTIETFSGSTSVGKSTAAAVYQIPSSVAPYMASTLSDSTGWYDIIGAYVQGQSKLKLSINANGSYGATIASITTIFDGGTYSGSSVTTNTILQTGNVTATITAKDSRGRTVTEKPTISVLAYSYPKLTAAESYRSDSGGSPNAKGAYITVKFSSNVTSLNQKNGAWYKVQYKKSTSSSYTEKSLDSYTDNFAVTNGTYTFAADESSYDINILVGDRFKTITYSVPGASVEHTWSMLKKNGKVVGMAFGKLAEHEGYFDLGWPLKCSGGGDSVIEQGVTNGWTYRKWDSGVAECWKTVEHSTTVATAWGGMYVGNAVARQTYPFSFIEKPVEIVSVTSGSKMGFLYPEQSGYGVNGASASAMYNVASLSSYTTAVTYYFNYHVIGRWK